MTDQTEMQIPDDVMESARIVAASVWNDAGIEIKEEHLFGSMDNTTGVRIAARAILAERTRCARVASRNLCLYQEMRIRTVSEIEGNP